MVIPQLLLKCKMSFIRSRVKFITWRCHQGGHKKLQNKKRSLLSVTPTWKAVSRRVIVLLKRWFLNALERSLFELVLQEILKERFENPRGTVKNAHEKEHPNENNCLFRILCYIRIVFVMNGRIFTPIRPKSFLFYIFHSEIPSVWLNFMFLPMAFERRRGTLETVLLW